MKKRNVWQGLKKHRKAVTGLLTLAICLGVISAVGGVFPEKNVTTGAGEIPEHDGDVLVDSLQITDPKETSENETDKEATDGEKAKTAEDSELVTSDDVSDMKNSDTYFEEMRATINMDRNQMISMLTDAEAQAENQSEKQNANNQKLKILDYMEQEQNVENVIKTKKLPTCLVLISDSGINVTVDKQDLNQTDVAKICDIVMRETGRKASEIVIQSKF